MNKKRIIIVAIIVIALVGIGAFNEFTDTSNDLNTSSISSYTSSESNYSSSTDTISETTISTVSVCEHNWVEATCNNPRKCSICDVTQGTKLGHDYQGTTCTTKGVCTRCGNIEPAYGHTWIDADCTTPKTCSVCGATEGKALGHTTDNGVCGRCGLELFKPIKYTGHGDDVISNVKIPAGDYKATIIHNGDRHFHVKFYYGDGKYDYVLLVNTSDPYSGVTLLKDGDNVAVENGLFEIEGDGDWSILIEKVSGDSTMNMKGRGDTVTGIIKGTGTRETIRIAHDGDRHFHVKLHELNGGKYAYDLLVNTSDPYSGTVLASLEYGKEYYFDIVGDGNWSIDFSKGDRLTSYK